MPKLKTKISSEIIEVAGFKVTQWTKQCAYCRKEYKTTARGQKYCSETCCKKDQKRRSKSKKEYDANKELARLASRAHALGVEVMTQLDRLGIRPKRCEICGETESLQVHHKNLDYTNNNPSNLQWLCTKCHASEHSKIDSLVKESGKSMLEVYDQNIVPLLIIKQ